ncbi:MULTISPECIES: sugar phosphate isomerase/epimerase family protein [unclassified Microbacterium]|uniref:sugar phosphate isomerase/epimerase family protein n=1 Tax=unclassified Microbacterium TaxID=2609290 RepID=UPI0004934E2B|nr:MULTISPECIES: sugar phosphate isomerase/epimerase family protein [unclassified Microbacterium]MCV0334184.1 sugar phosphate isomerase/epimerase [Microbacterium sp.]MCV0374288.1 sugar phosphate isomerase/epimerase [Microbacterium sp.]MCV0389360.1 sugar phosphate isomerase/epimerase [Microbacterium sp.]MCV0418894.1 sugar phosphate isomerase/epimerase [Microbacterium sp.]MCV0421200.1 sugar phosphate isomerase/epimerase [Microbacterium sp.]
MNIGCHGLVWTGNFDAEGIRLAVRKTKEAGFDLIEFPLMDPFSFDVSVAKDALEEYDLAVSASLGLSEATDVTSSDPTIVAAGEALLLKAVDVLADLGGQHFCGVIYSAMKKYMEPVTAEGLASSKAAIARVADHAAERGVSVALEVVNRYETNVLNTARQALEYVAEVDRPNLGIHIDTYHMNIEESDMFAPVLDAAPALRYVHIGESHRGYLGTGTVDFDTFFKALGRIGYDGPIVFESFSSAVVAPDLSRMLGIWRNLWNDNVELGAHANAYIRDKLVAVESIRLH